MSVDTPEVKEKEVAGWPGWTKMQLGTSRRYRSPGGVDISAARFMRLSAQYKAQGYIPESVLVDDVEKRPGVTAPGFFSFSGEKPKSPRNQTETKSGVKEPGTKFTDEPLAKELVDIIESEPKSRSRTGGRKHPRPTQAALSIGFKQLILLLTAVVLANVMNDNRFAMSDQEATALAIAMANLLEPTEWNEKWGWLIADTGDWQMIGYVLGGYIIRCYSALKEKQDARRQNSGSVHQPASAGTNPGQTNGQYQFVPNRTASPIGVTQPPGTR